ncbi:hypothetical protein F511_47428 [Dorcoceras hygrometricum]|uniref:Uncharacterized protein n=1 Tax=Dorcoceras hygrometricum TaxID=472368 RepID=A0A2Z6ZR14_9LAMI|nr:hypothetical protein F511_47428 [Dorcoceras hygrometricum]
MAGALPSGPPPDPGGSNVTNLASNRGLTREKQSLQVDAPAMLRAVTTTCWYHGSFSRIRPPMTEPFRLDHPQFHTVPTRPTLAPTSMHEGELTLGRSRIAHAETHTARCPTSSLRFGP